MYYINKIVGWMSSPLGILFIGLAVAWIAKVRESGSLRLKFRAHRWIAGLTLGFAWLMGCGITIRLIGLPLEVDEIDLMTLPKADAIVVLGGGVGVHAKCGRPEMFAGADRVWAAARLYRSGKAPMVIVTSTNDLATTGLLSDFGVPTNAIRCVGRARNTEEEAKDIVRLFDLRDCLIEGAAANQTIKQSDNRTILLVTSAWHMKRAKMMFEKYAPGLAVIAAPTDYEMHGAAENPVEFADFLPNAEALVRNSYAIKEWVARFGYALLRR